MTPCRKGPVGLFVVGLLICGGRTTLPQASSRPTTDHVPRAIVQLPMSDVASAIRASVHDGSALSAGSRSAALNDLTSLYQAGGYLPLWVDGTGRPTRDAHDTLALFASAAREGLDPADYRTSILESAATALDTAAAPSVASVAAFDASVSASALRFLRHLHAGRVDPRAIGFRMTASPDAHDFAAWLRSALAEHRVPELAAELEPPLALYRGLRTALVRYRELAADPMLQSVPVPKSVLKPGDSYTGLGALVRLLAALGDLSGEIPAPTEVSVYEGPLVDAIRRFQTRHGLDADGVIGVRTQQALRVPLAWRVRQIELALERLRWLPDLNRDRFLAVNIPMFRLLAWDSMPPNGAPSFLTNVIVGRALNRQTPVFVEQMDYVIFRPYWNVPSSILRGEILPALARAPGYLERHDMEIVSGAGDDARAVPLTAESIMQLRQGRLRVRQRPGPGNSLGLVKFVFPNDANVYLHDTPAPELFSRSRRDFSHGCVRVEDAVGLAEWALNGQDGWSRDQILETMNGTQTLQVNLTRPIQVMLFYITAVVVSDDGSIHFAEDIYGHDTKLDEALGPRGLQD